MNQLSFKYGASFNVDVDAPVDIGCCTYAGDPCTPTLDYVSDSQNDLERNIRNDEGHIVVNDHLLIGKSLHDFRGGPVVSVLIAIPDPLDDPKTATPIAVVFENPKMPAVV
jgi:hypothetical protein